jgi:K+-transporting ATPase ATPase B chain
VEKYVHKKGGTFPSVVRSIVDDIAKQGATPLVVAEGNNVLGVIRLNDIVKGGIKERFAEMRKMGIKTVMITGDNPLTAAAVAAEAGVDDFLAEAGNLVDLDSNPTKLIQIVEIGKQLLMTRGTLTTFSIANDVAKYFAILPAAFLSIYPALGALNIMGLKTPESAVLSAVIFNALIIIFLVPLALRGVKYRPLGASVVLRNNALIYGVGGLMVPFIGIKLVDMIITAMGIV